MTRAPLCLTLLALTGCVSAGMSADIVMGPTIGVTNPMLNPNDPRHPIERRIDDNDKVIYRWPDDTTITLDDTTITLDGATTVPMQRNRINYGTNIEGHINTETYPVALDTGSPFPIMINSHHIVENELPFFPLDPRRGTSPSFGLALVPELRLGDMTMANLHAFYQARHTKVEMWGIPVARGRAIMIGLPLMQEFSYITIDRPAMSVTFAKDIAFTPGDGWARVPTEARDDNDGDYRLFATLPINGERQDWQFDTGSTQGLVCSRERWEQLAPLTEGVELRDGRAFFPFVGRGGFLDCQIGHIPEWQIGPITLTHVKVAVFDEEPIPFEGAGLGMQPFRDHAITVDFQSDVLWIGPESVDEK